jgi:hypothetical protein
LKHIRVKGKTEKKAPKDAVDEMMNKRPDHAVQVYPPPSRPDPSEDPLRRNLQWRVDYSVDYGDKGFNRIGYFKTKWGAQRSIKAFVREFDPDNSTTQVRVFLTKQRLTDI